MKQRINRTHTHTHTANPFCTLVVRAVAWQNRCARVLGMSISIFSWILPSGVSLSQIYIYIYPGVSAGCPPFYCLQVSWLSTCWSAGCPRTGSHYKSRRFWQSLECTVEIWFWWKSRLWCCRFDCILGVERLSGRKNRVGVPEAPAWISICMASLVL